MPYAVLGIGGNIGNILENIETVNSAVELLPETKIKNSSSIYKTPPWGVTDQPDFFNQCLLIDTYLSPHTLLGACLGIEAAIGRIRKQRWRERIIDIDLILYENVNINSKELTLPHPRMMERAFVLVPLNEILCENNVFGLDLKATLNEIDCTGIEKIKNSKKGKKDIDKGEEM